MQLPPSSIAAFPLWRYGLAAFVVIVLGAYFFLGRGTNLGATLTISQGDFKEQVSVSGTVIAAQDVDLGFAANGRIAGIYARVGQYVGQGAVLAEIENGDLVASVRQKQAALASLLAGTRLEQLAIDEAAVASDQNKLVNAITSAYTVSDDAIHNKIDGFFSNPRTDPKLSFTVSNTILRTTVESNRFAIEVALTNWALLVSKLSATNAADSAKQSQAYLALITTFLADMNTAISQGVPDPTVTSSVLTSYGTTLATARTNVSDTATKLTGAASDLTDAQKTLALNQAGATVSDIAAAQADIQNAQALFARTRITAPFSGIVTRMDAKVGQIVAPTESKISMQSNGIFQIETYIPEVNIARVASGNPATTTLDAYGSAVAFPATVVAVDPAETVKDGVPTYKTTLSFLSADPSIRSGMTANVTIVTGTLHDAIVIPAGAVGIKEGVQYVSVMDNDKAVSRPIVTGSSPALAQIQILSGLAAGEVILLTPVP